MKPAAQQVRSPLGLFPGQATPRLYDRLVQAPRVRRYSRRPAEAYVHWVGRFIRFHEHRHPRYLTEADANRFLTHLAGQTVQELLSHKDVRTTMVYTHVLNRGGHGVRSPADGLAPRPGER